MKSFRYIATLSVAAAGLATQADTIPITYSSNTVVDQGDQSLPNARNLSDWTYAWGQFIDHDLDLTTSGDHAFDIPVPAGDPFFDPENTGNQVIFFSRSIYDAATGTPVPNVQQRNWSINY